jgi:hypothetical protein
VLGTKPLDYANFHLRVETMRTDGEGTTRLHFCALLPEEGGTSYVIDINRTEQERALGTQRTGTLHRGHPLIRGGVPVLQSAEDTSLKPGEWFFLEVILTGDRVRVLVKEKLVIDYTDNTKMRKQGRILLAKFTTTIRIRTIEIKELPPIAKSEPPPSNPDKPQANKPSAEGSTSSPVARMATDLAKTSGPRFELLLHTYRIGKGTEYTEALCLAIPQMSGDSQQKAREALAERLARMKDETLVEYLQDEDDEIRRAAAFAIGQKESKTLIPNLIALLRDHEMSVVRAAHASLKLLTDKDFGPAAKATREERDQAVLKWTAWWSKQRKKSDAPPQK